MGHIDPAVALVTAGLLLVLGYIAYAALRRLPRKLRQVRANVNRHGVRYFANRRNVFRSAAVLIGAGVALRLTNSGPVVPPAIAEGFDNVTGDLPDSDIGGIGQPTGQRRFNLSAGGYDAVEWLDDGRLRITFQDDPPMQEWYLVGPKPERKVLASGRPPNFGGTRTVALNHPVSVGEYLLTGAKIEADPDSIMGMEAERTGTARFTVEPDLLLTAVEASGEDGYRAQVTVRNVGSAPYRVEGVKFGDSVPGTGTWNFMGFRSEPPVLVPTNAVTLTSDEKPFYNPETESQTVPETFRVGIWAHEQAFWFEYDAGELRRVEKTPTPN